MENPVTDREAAIVYEFTVDRTSGPIGMARTIAMEAIHAMTRLHITDDPAKIETYVDDAKFGDDKVRVAIVWGIPIN